MSENKNSCLIGGILVHVGDWCQFDQIFRYGKIEKIVATGSKISLVVSNIEDTASLVVDSSKCWI